MIRSASRLALILSCGACTPWSRDAPDEALPAHAQPTAEPSIEQPPAEPAHVEAATESFPPPCSVDGMLLRDTPITTFEYRCPRTSLPPEGDAARCIADAIAAERPFLAELVMPKPQPAHQQPVLVGATFDGHYTVRMYQGDEVRGERISIVFSQLGPDGELTSTVHPTRLRCSLDGKPPANVPASEWQTLDRNRGQQFHAGRCVEWFDPAVWRMVPWAPRFDPNISLACTEAAQVAVVEPEPPPKVEVDPVSARACACAS